MSASFKLGGLSIETSAYASQGSAILGIRGSGKTYTATLLAEKLFEAKVPFVAFDPIGVWRFLKVPGKGRGYPVVVAGGKEPDLPLTVNGAPEIMRAAMRNGVSIVIDLFDINLSKADWKRIVTACVRVLLHENSQYGLRHVFLEEAAEFAPQRIQPDQGAVYAEIEKLARMGGNSRLGYTLINQRAEEVNKAVLELCDNILLHRQKGRNSLTALDKWLDIGNVKDKRAITETLATLPTGECWAWLEGTDQPERIKVQAKNSLHPDRTVMRDAKTASVKPVDVGAFVKEMKGSLVEVEKEAEANDPAKLRKQIAELQKQIKSGGGIAEEIDPRQIDAAWHKGYQEGYDVGRIDGVTSTTDALRKALDAVPSKPMRPAKSVKAVLAAKPPIIVPTPKPVFNASADISGPQQKILRSLSFWRSIGHDAPSKAQVAAVAGYSPIGGAFGNPMGQLRSSGMIDYPQQGRVSLTGKYAGGHMSADEAKAMLLSVLGGPERKIVEAFRWQGGEQTREEIAARAGYAPVGGAFGNPVGRLCTLGILTKPGQGKIAMSDWALEVMM